MELTADPGVPTAALERIPGVRGVSTRHGERVFSVDALHVGIPALLEILREEGCTLVDLKVRRATLDDVFLGLTGRSLREAST